ncbi:MAG: TraB domain-containing protein [Candidatus Thermoplasmatota archaeon]|nr:TraB domain-containing protein [Candidatus Thermoplasmatota archaeon]
MLTLIGVAHVFDLAQQIERLILDKSPNVVGVELDKTRYLALKQKLPRTELSLPYKLLALFQQKVAAKYGTKVGQEMLIGVETARKLNIDVAFIDMEGVQIFAKLWKSMRFDEKLKFLLGGFFGLFIRKERIERELAKFEASYDQYMELFGNEFPTVKRVLIDERDQWMANRIRKLCEKYANVLAIVGDGHIEGLKKLLSELEPEVVRLSGLRKIPLGKTSEVRVSYTIRD